MKITHTLRKRFVKDCKLPIPLIQDPYFDYFLDLYENFYSTRSLYDTFCSLVEKLGGEDSFFKESKKITDSIIRDISKTKAYLDFTKRDLSRYDVKSEVKKRNIYHQDHVNKAFASFDLVKANYNALRYIDPEIVLNTSSYEDLLRKYTDETYFVNSKHIRQVIFGHLNPKRQRKIERFLIQNKVIPEVVKILPGKHRYVSASDDEVVVKLELFEAGMLDIAFKEGLDNFKTDVPIRFSSYILRQLGDRPYFYKQFSKGTFPPVEFKAIPQNYFAECYRFYKKEEPTDYDRCTYHDGRVVKFLDPLFN